MIRAVIIEQDDQLGNFLKIVLEKRGYEVLLFTDPGVCPLAKSDLTCQKDSPCADILIVDYQTSQLSAADFVEKQFLNGCKAPSENKALLIDPLHRESYYIAKQLGCTLLYKPFKLDKLYSWLIECEKRI